MAFEYTLGDLLAEPTLNLRQLTGSAATREAPVHGAHSIEVDNPSQWLDPGWMMLTLGIRLRKKPAEQRRLIADLQDLGASALGFGLGVAFKSIPPALLDEAESRNFPLLSVPADTQFQQISRAVFQGTTSSDAQTYSRLTALQTNLLRAFADPDPLESTTRRLARLSNSTVAIISTSGTVYASTGSLPFDEIARRLSPQTIISSPASTGNWDVLSAPLAAWGHDRSVFLVLANRTSMLSAKLGRTMLDVAVPIFEALGKLTLANRRQDQALSKALVDNALSKELSDVEASQFDDHLDASGIDTSLPLQCVTIRPISEADMTLLDDIEERLVKAAHRFRSVYSRRTSELVLVTGRNSALIDCLRTALGPNALEHARVGIGRAVNSAAHLAVSYRDSNIVHRYLVQEKTGSVLTFDDLDLASQLIAEVPPDRVAAKVEAITDLLLSNPIQLEALRAYFSTCQDVQSAAKSIFVHANTLRYRLERFETALGRSLRDPSTIASLHYVLSLMPDDPQTECSRPPQTPLFRAESA